MPVAVAMPVGAAMPVAVVVGVGATVAVVWVIVIVMVSVPVLTVMVIGLVTGAAIWLTTAALPAIVAAIGAVLPVVAAVCAATLFPVIATIPVGLAVTFFCFVQWFSHHSSSLPFADLTMMNCLVAATTTPRWAANCVRCHVNWLKVRIGAIWASVLSDRDWFEFHILSAEVRACCSLTVWWKFSTYPA